MSCDYLQVEKKLIAYVIIIQSQLYVMRSTFQTLGWIPSMAKCLCLDSSCEPSGPDYSDPKQVGDIDFLVRKTQLRSCAAHWIQAGVPGCSNLSVLAARVPCRVPNTTTDRNLRGKKRHHKNRTRCLVSD